MLALADILVVILVLILVDILAAASFETNHITTDPKKLPIIHKIRDQSKVRATPIVMTLAMQC